jgi:cell wall-associated NlpC family hydrolase
MEKKIKRAKELARTHKNKILAGLLAAALVIVSVGIGTAASGKDASAAEVSEASEAVQAAESTEVQEAVEASEAVEETKAVAEVAVNPEEAETVSDVAESELVVEASSTGTSVATLLPVLGVGGSLEGDEVIARQAEELGLEIVLMSELYEEYGNLAIANVDHYVKVRSESNTNSEVVGRMYDGSVAEVLSSVTEEDGEWLQVISGDVEGYIKAEYFITGVEAAKVIDQYTKRYATITANRLNVRSEPDAESARIGYLTAGEQVEYIEVQGDWILIQYTDSKQGYISAEYATLSEEYIYARSMEEIRAEIAAQEALKARQAAAAAAAAAAATEDTSTAEDTTIVVTAPDLTNETTTELRQSIVDYALQFVGNKYVHGGQSLTTGTDCSGFTCYIYKDFGYSLSRTPSGQYSSAGKSVSLDEIQPGDIICYGKSSCTHVALYIGGGQVVHAANSRKGVIISDINYMNVLGARNVID